MILNKKNILKKLNNKKKYLNLIKNNIFNLYKMANRLGEIYGTEEDK